MEGLQRGRARDTANTDIQSGELNFNEPIHEVDTQINDMQMSQDRTYFITAGKDKSAKVRTGQPFHLKQD